MTTSLRTNIGENLVQLPGSWPDWSGRDTGVTFDRTNGHLEIPPPVDGRGNTYAIRRYRAPLTATLEYELTMPFASDPNAAVLLFLADANGNFIPFPTDAGGTAPWITATADEPRRFAAPPNVAGYVIQVQSAWQATTRSSISPALFQVEPDRDCRPVISRSRQFTEGFILNAFFNTAQISGDGSTVGFIGVPPPTGPQGLYLYTLDVESGLLQLVSDGEPDGGLQTVSVSANGRFVAFSADASEIIPGDPDANGRVEDVFLFDRQTGVTERVTPGTGQQPARLRPNPGFNANRLISANGRFILLTGSARELIPTDPSSCSDCDDSLIYDRQSGTFSRLLPASIDNSGSGPMTMSDNGRFIVFSSSVTNLIADDTDPNGDERDIYALDRNDGSIARVIYGFGGTGALHPSVSDDGRYVAFAASSDTIIPGVANATQAVWHVYLIDREQGLTVRLNHDRPNTFSASSMVSANGEAVIFRTSPAPNPISRGAIYLYHRPSQALAQVSESDNAAFPSLSGDARRLSFNTNAINVLDVDYPCR